MPSEYVSIPTITDPDALAQDAFDYLETKSPEWRPHDGQLDVWILAAVARMIATLLDTMTDVEARIFRYLGASIFQIAPLEATNATGSATFTVADSTGHTIPAGTAVAVPTSGGELVAFETKEELIIPATKTTGSVAIVAIEPGSEGTELGTPGVELTMLDQLASVVKITLNAATGGGQDAEEDETYLSRLVSELRLMAPRPILPNDFAELARFIPGVHRALALNGYDPADGLFTHERTVALVTIDINGAECNAAIKKQVEEFLLSKREVNFIIKMISATYTEIGVEFEINKWPEWNAEDVHNRVIEALNNYLSPAVWGLPPFGDQALWYTREKVLLKDIIAVIGSVSGVEDVLKVKLKKVAEAAAEADITLPGVAPLPKLGTMTGTVV